jgi:hypothetical protein
VVGGVVVGGVVVGGGGLAIARGGSVAAAFTA